MNLSRKHKRTALATLALLLLLLGILAAYLRFRPDPQVEKVKEMRDQLAGEAGRQLSPEERRERWQQLRQEMQQLSPKQRREVWADRRQASRERLARFSRMSPAERVAFLDEQIRRMEAARRQRQASGGGAGAGNSQGPGGSRGRPGLSSEQRDQLRRNRLDNTTPQERQQRADYFRQLADRRLQLGLPARPFGR